MKQELKYLTDFILRVVFQWVTLLLLLPTLYDFLHVYFPEPIKSYELSSDLRLAFMIFAVFIAIYKVWRKEHSALLSIQGRKTRFTVTPGLYKIQVAKHLQQIDKKIDRLKSELPNLESEGIFDRLMVSPFSGGRKTQQSVQEYIESLMEYKEELIAFCEKHKGILGIDVTLESDKYDENLSVEFILKTGKIVRSLELDCPWLPSDPSKDRLSFLGTVDIRERDVYRTNLEYDDKVISCNLKYLKKGQPVLFINEGVYVDPKVQKLSFDVCITSKNSDGLQKFSFDQEVGKVNDYKDISELEEFNREL
ncbi:hypothetical protein KKE34_05430 [Patescibacteria group bacterium]|nr:hypothetical protein [Patescibacteria group bacterium]MBU1886013.1 hypothetical protein [Patescibacteria group bacterium]